MTRTLPDAARLVLRELGLDPDAPNLLDLIKVTASGADRDLLSSHTYKMTLGEGFGVLSKVMHLAPATESGVNTCPFAGNCAGFCIKTIGQMVTRGALRARVLRTLWWHLDPESFLEKLDAEIKQHGRRAARKGMHAAVRLNGTSDILWERFGVPQRNPEITHYDYSKVPLDRRRELPDNYSLTYSVSEVAGSMQRAIEYLRAGHTAAVVIQSKTGTTRKQAVAEVQRILERGELLGFPVVNGDLHDIRFRDPAGSFVLLAAKGAAARDHTGFTYRDAFTPRRRLVVA